MPGYPSPRPAGNHRRPRRQSCSIGLLLCLTAIPPGVDDREVAAAAARAGIEASPLSPFAQLPLRRGALILNFSGYDELTIRTAAPRLGGVVREMMEGALRQALGA